MGPMAVPPDDTKRYDRRGKAWTVGELRQRVSLLEPGILQVREVPDSNAEVFGALVDIASEMSADIEDCVVIMNLTEATARPDPPMMKEIMRSAKTLGIHGASVKPSNAIVKAILKFVLARAAGATTISLHDTVEEALVHCRKVREEAQLRRRNS